MSRFPELTIAISTTNQYMSSDSAFYDDDEKHFINSSDSSNFDNDSPIRFNDKFDSTIKSLK